MRWSLILLLLGCSTAAIYKHPYKNLKVLKSDPGKCTPRGDISLGVKESARAKFPQIIEKHAQRLKANTLWVYEEDHKKGHLTAISGRFFNCSK